MRTLDQIENLSKEIEARGVALPEKVSVRRVFEGRAGQAVVGAMLGAVLLAHSQIDAKAAFLNVYFLPVILAAIFLGRWRAGIGALISVLAVTMNFLSDPGGFGATDPARTLDAFLQIGTWALFLVSTGMVLGAIQERLVVERARARQTGQQLQVAEVELAHARMRLKQQDEAFEGEIERRTAELVDSKAAIERRKEKVEQALHRTMDPSVVDLMIRGRLRNEKRQVSVLFADLSGFTSYAEDLPPEVVIGDLNRYLAGMEPVLLKYRGHIDKYIGDGIMVEFGAPLDSAMHRLQAVVAAMKLQETVQGGDFPWRMRVGIASGATIAGLIGSRRQSYTAIGDVVNLASRLEQMARPGEILVDHATYESIRHLVTGERRREWLGDSEDLTRKEAELDALRGRFTADSHDASIAFRMAELHQDLGEMSDAVSLFERAVRLAPERSDYKVAYADARMQATARTGIAVKGKSQRIEAYAITGFRDPLTNRNVIPERFYDAYSDVAARIGLSGDLVLPVEVLDGSIGHSTLVAVIAYALADQLGLTDKQKTETMEAAFLADIGKHNVPNHLLSREGSLGIEEFEVIREHPVESVRVLRGLGWTNPRVLDIVRHSHERFNGTGYPDGLPGDKIPVGARIVAVADCYVALTSKRPYREAWERKAALGEIASGAQTGDYDPGVAEVLGRLMT